MTDTQCLIWGFLSAVSSLKEEKPDQPFLSSTGKVFPSPPCFLTLRDSPERKIKNLKSCRNENVDRRAYTLQKILQQLL